MDDLNALYFKYWGKADRDDPSRYHLLPYHFLDVQTYQISKDQE